MWQGVIQVRRAYDPPMPSDGRRVLVDRMWPRGLSKEAACLDAWVKEVAPSDSLRRWFGHDPAKWSSFVSRYHQELNENPAALAALAEELRGSRVTFVYAAKDEAHNNAVALKDFVVRRGASGSRDPRHPTVS